VSTADPAQSRLPAAAAVSASRFRIVWILTFLAVATAAVLPFLPALDGQFLNWDDEENFLRNQGFRGLGWTQLHWMFSTTLLGHWIPLTWLSLGVNYALGGMNPRGYHLGNILLHAVGAVVFWLIARRLLRAAWGGDAAAGATDAGAVFAALLFAAHPLRVESVAWITERRDVLSGVFFLLSVWAYLRAAAGGAELRRGWYRLSVAAFGTGLLAKASGIPLPAALLLLDVYPLRRSALGWRRLVGEKLPHLVLAGAATVVTLWAVRHGMVVTGYGEYAVWARVAMTAYSLFFYPWAWFWPTELSPMYELPARVSPLAFRFLVPLVLVPAITAALIVVRRRWPAGLVVWLYSCVMILPVSGAVHAGFQLAHDRYSYLSGLGLAVLAGGGLVAVLRAGEQGRLRSWLVGVLVGTAALVVVGLGAETWRQSRLWRDSETLWRWAVSVDPECALCHNNLGSALAVGAPSNPVAVAEAETHFRRAIALRPERDEPYNNLGGALALQSRLDESAAAFGVFLSRRPNVGSAAASLGSIYVRQGRFSEAIPLLRRGLGLDPRLEGARRDLALALNHEGDVLRRQGNAAEAQRLDQEATALRAGMPAAQRPIELPGRDRTTVQP
jgi:hypothetical protein